MKNLVFALSLLMSAGALAQSANTSGEAASSDQDIVVTARKPLVGVIVGAECNSRLGLGAVHIRVREKVMGQLVMVDHAVKVNSYSLCGSMSGGGSRLMEVVLANQGSTLWINQLVFQDGFVTSMLHVGVSDPRSFAKGIKGTVVQGETETMGWYFDAKTGPAYMSQARTPDEINRARTIAIEAAVK